ncbi:unnamed protein product [Diabrotica balteata]|uniref:Uncharacterized protein n=1 Tax=Diabrotica balteata TaxID=107213 RepID=A0A9P0DYP2_DIABA|nr:unnamed protein product [Diabrotica balteata]
MTVKTILVSGIIAVLCITCVSCTDEKIPNFDECLKESGTSMDDLKAIPIKMTHEIICFHKCMYEKIGAIDKDGKIQPDVIMKHIKKHMEVSADDEKSTVDCLGKIPKMTVCEDLDELTKCLEDLRHQQ